MGDSFAQNYQRFDCELSMWIAAQVRTNREFSVASALTGKGYEAFVPAYETTRQWSDRKRVMQVPLISGYVFVRSIAERVQALVISTPGVTRMVGFGGDITPIADEEIEYVRTVANSPFHKEPWSYIKQHSRVRIAQGSLTGVLGTVLQVKENTLLVVSIEMLQRSVAVHIDRSWVEVSKD